MSVGSIQNPWVRLNGCDEEKVRPDDQWSFLRTEIKKKFLPLAGSNLWSNYTMGKYSQALCKSPSIWKHPPWNDSSTPGGEPGTKAVPAQTALDFAKLTHKVTALHHKTFPCAVPDIQDPAVKTQHHGAMNASKHLESILSSATFPIATFVHLEYPFLSNILAYEKKHALFWLGRCWSCRNLLELWALRGWAEGRVVAESQHVNISYTTDFPELDSV